MVVLEKEEKEELEGFGKRDVGFEGRKSYKMVVLLIEVEKLEGEVGLGMGRVVWFGYVEWRGC